MHHLWRYSQGITLSEGLKVQRLAVASENLATFLSHKAITWKQCKIGFKLLLITNKK